jgi:hypothetical protein
MENYYYLDKEELTSYDKYVLSKRNPQVESAAFPYIEQERPTEKAKDLFFEEFPNNNIEEEKRKFNEYDKYLFSQLNRTGPTSEKVLTENEFYGSSVEKKQKKEKTIGKVLNNVTFKKGGKIILAFYVIIMIALASILIVANTSGTLKHNFANATLNSLVENKAIVTSMTIEENDSEQDNWFDRLCDAMNK